MQPGTKNEPVRIGIRIGIEQTRKSTAIVALGILGLLFDCWASGMVPVAFGQDAAASGDEMPAIAPDAGEVPESDTSPLAQAYRVQLAELKKQMKNLRRKIVEHHTDLSADRDSKLQEWQKVSQAAREASHQFRKAAIDLYRSDSQRYSTVGDLLFGMLKEECEADRFEGMNEVGKVLVEQQYPNPDTDGIAGLAAFGEHDFEFSEQCLRRAIQTGVDTAVPPQVLQSIEQLKEDWKKELELRQAEARADDLPRVRISTTKGVIVLELFEDDAPETVANFLYLSKNGFYDGRPIFRVLKHFVAQTGCERGDGSGSAGYTVRGEMKSPRARKHFRGSVAVALGSDPATQTTDYDSGSAQFFFDLLASPPMNGEYCVFGRVIEGMEVLGELTKIDLSSKDAKEEYAGMNPDSMVRVEILRQRNSSYIPKPLTGKLPF
jgi:cyclophilin family peptidyl-prolyl cis-trans isomerase